MECGECTRTFNAQERRPKVLPCGHSFCLPCVKRLRNKECPLDKKRFRHPPDRLPDNLMLIEAEQDKKKERQQLAVPPSLQRPVGTTASPLRLWCRFCNSEVTESHADQPCASLCSLKKPRSEEPRPVARRVEEAAALLLGHSHEQDPDVVWVDGFDYPPRRQQQAQPPVEVVQLDDDDEDEAFFEEEISGPATFSDLAADAIKLVFEARSDSSRRAATAAATSVPAPPAPAAAGTLTATVRPMQRVQEAADKTDQPDQPNQPDDDDLVVVYEHAATKTFAQLEPLTWRPVCKEEPPSLLDDEEVDKAASEALAPPEDEVQAPCSPVVSSPAAEAAVEPAAPESQAEGALDASLDLMVVEVRGGAEDIFWYDDEDDEAGAGPDDQPVARRTRTLPPPPIIKMELPSEEPVPWKEKPNKGGRRNEWMSMCMVEGRRVVRGPDWPEECVEDGHKPGTVLGYDHISATVEWDVGGVGRYDMGLKQGNKKIYKLRLLPRGDLYQTVGGVEKGDPAFLDVESISRKHNLAKKKAFVAAGNLEGVRVLMNLHCGVSPAWSMDVLRRVGPNLESLRLLMPDEDHLTIVQSMPKLTHLFLSSVNTKCMEMALGMPWLEELEASCPFEAPLEPLRLPARPTLEYMCLAIYPLSVTLSVLRAHADTLVDLWLVAACKEPYGCPDLAGELKKCKLKKLEKMVIYRESDFEFCQHDANCCSKQKRQLEDMFTSTGLSVEVSCNECDFVPEKKTKKAGSRPSVDDASHTAGAPGSPGDQGLRLRLVRQDQGGWATSD